MTTLPTWAVWLESFGTPALTLVGVLIAQAIHREGAKDVSVMRAGSVRCHG